MRKNSGNHAENLCDGKYEGSVEKDSKIMIKIGICQLLVTSASFLAQLLQR